jgi:pimeloyl-ACP methyl ester carboxylesterase
LIVVLMAAACTTAGSQSAPVTPARERCDIAGAGSAWCTSVRVRESAASGRDINLRVVVLPAHAAAPLADPIVPLVGGPGQGAADLASALAPRYAPYRDQRDIVFVDQRGTGQSNGLRCESPIATADLMGRLFDHPNLAACREALARHADLTGYTTALSARDYGAVLDQLGYRQANIIGASYGSRLALEIVRQLPLRVRTMTIESVVPHDFTWPATGAADADAALSMLIDDCTADAACRQAFPRFRQDVDLAFTRIRGEPATVAVRDPATGTTAPVPFGHSDLAYATRGILYGNDALSLPLWFSSAADGDFTPFAQFYVNRARNLDRQIALGVHFGVYCAEDVPFVDRAAAEAAAAGTHLGRYLIDQYHRACEVWPAGAVDASFRESVTSAVPALVLAGRRDPATPPRTAQQVVRTLTKSKLVIWPHGAHGTDGLSSAQCRISIMRDFLRTADPDAPSIACATRDQLLPFRIR